jgi:hypothetical protein
MAYSVIINLEYDGDPSQVAMAIRDILKSMTGQDVSLRLNRSDSPSSVSKIATLQASQYVKRRPQI